jgi:hypothetical protein
LYKNCCQVFVRVNKHFEYLLENPNYIDERIFMTQHLGRCELAFKHNLDVMHAYQKSACNIQSEGGVGNWGVEAKMGKTNEMF